MADTVFWARLAGLSPGLISKGLTMFVGVSEVATGILVLDLVSIVNAVVNQWLALGMPLHEARKLVYKQGYQNGYSCGVVAAAFYLDESFLKNNLLQMANLGRTWGTENYSQDGFNKGLAMGYLTAVQGSDQSKKELADALTQRIIANARAKNLDVNWMQNGDWRTWVLRYAAVYKADKFR